MPIQQVQYDIHDSIDVMNVRTQTLSHVQTLGFSQIDISKLSVILIELGHNIVTTAGFGLISVIMGTHDGAGYLRIIAQDYGPENRSSSLPPDPERDQRLAKIGSFAERMAVESDHRGTRITVVMRPGTAAAT